MFGGGDGVSSVMGSVGLGMLIYGKYRELVSQTVLFQI